MSGKLVSAAILAAAFGAAPAFADLRGPAELPPASYAGQQYVDSRGCVFLRGGYGGQVTWVPRVTRDRKQLCGYPPSGRPVEVAEAPAPAPQPPVQAPVVAEAPRAPAPPATPATPVTKPAAAAPVVAERPPTATERAATTEVRGTPATVPSGEGYRLACPARAPVPERFEMHGGGSKVLCTTGDGSLAGATFPVLVAGSLAGYPTGYDAHMAAGTVVTAGGAGSTVAPGGTGHVAASTKSAKYPDPAPPAGYKTAWKDDRLNPNRGKQTVDGFLAMDEIWTRTVPSELREDSTVTRKKVKVIVRRADGTEVAREGYVTEDGSGKRTVTVLGGNEVTMSTKSDPKVKPVAKAPAAKSAPKAGSGRLLVQVGTYGVPSNAEGAAGKLRALGLPVARGSARSGSLQVIYAGPFASAGEAKAALAAARRAGFGDAVIVQ